MICVSRFTSPLKSMGDAESIRNLFEQVGRGGRGSLTIDDLCLSVIAPPLMEKIRDDLIGDKIQINKQTSDEWRLVQVSNPNSASAHSVVLIRRTRSRTVSNHMQLENTVRTFSTARATTCPRCQTS